MASGCLLDVATAPYAGKGTGEHALLRQLMSSFKSGDIVLGDAYYASFFLIAELKAKGVDVVFHKHAARGCDFRKGKRLGKGDHIVEWKKPPRPPWMDKASYEEFPKTLSIRESRVVCERAGLKSFSYIIVSTLLDHRSVSVEDMGTLYAQRWFVELNLRSLKETLQMGILRGKTPAMVKREIWAHILAYNLIRALMVQAAIRHHKRPVQMSFKLALQAFSVFQQAGLLSTGEAEYFDYLLGLISYRKTGNQPNRSEPRRVKRRPKPFPLLQKHRHLYRTGGV